MNMHTNTHTHRVIVYTCLPLNSMTTCRPAFLLILIFDLIILLTWCVYNCELCKTSVPHPEPSVGTGGFSHGIQLRLNLNQTFICHISKPRNILDASVFRWGQIITRKLYFFICKPPETFGIVNYY